MHGTIPNNHTDDPGWYCLRTTMPGIFEAWGDLAQRGFDTYLLLSTHISQRRTYKKPLLGPYVFVWSTPFGIGRAYAAKHVCRQYSLTYFPNTIAEPHIAALWLREADGEFIFKDTATAWKKRKQILRSLQALAILKNERQYADS